MTKSTPHTIRIIVVPSITISPLSTKVLHALLQSIKNLGAGQRNSISFFGAVGVHTQSVLLDPCAAPLNEQNQHDHKQYPTHYANNCRTVHLSFLLSSMASIEQFE
jgi:hypothetical protein